MDEEAFLMQAVQLIRNLITRSVHGSALPLSSLLKAVKDWINQASGIIALSEDQSMEEASTARFNLITRMLLRLQDDIELSEEIKVLAVRTCFGVAIKACNPFEETSPKCIYRWEAISTTNSFPDEAQAIIREMKATRSRYGKLVASIAKVAEAVSKQSDDSDAKVAELESRVSKLVLELEKAKEKKADSDRKRDARKEEDRKRKEEERLRREAEKVKKEQEKEAARLAKLREKEEANEKKRLEQQKRQQEKQVELDEKAREKEREVALKQKKQEEKVQVLEKQKNFFKNFLSKAATTTPMNPPEARGRATVVRRALVTSFDEESFESSIRSQEQTMSEIVRFYKDKYNHSSAGYRAQKTMRKPKILYVPVTPSANSAFEFVEGYYETKVVKVDSRIRTLSFYTDERPPYVYVHH
jgi:myosin heavy subunit